MELVNYNVAYVFKMFIYYLKLNKYVIICKLMKYGGI